MMKKTSQTILLGCLIVLTIFAGAPAASGEAVSNNPVSPGKITTSPKLAWQSYTVQNGDSLYRIARRYKLSFELIVQVNQLTSTRIYPGQILAIPAGDAVPMPEAPSLPSTESTPAMQSVPNENPTNAPVHLTAVTIDKSDHTLTLSVDGVTIKTYSIALGDGGPDDKNVSGDHKTPEGEFYITEKKVIVPPDSTLGSRWIRLSYPNTEDADRGVRQGIIDQSTHDEIVNAIANRQTPPQYTALGSAVGIHGGLTPAKGLDWTWGSAALSNADIEELFDYVQIGTKVVIQK
jgi:LysM repeat protein